jgi:hypothetical protein
LPDDKTISAPAGNADRRHIAGLGALFGLLYFVQGIVEPTEGCCRSPSNPLLGTGTIPRPDGMDDVA